METRVIKGLEPYQATSDGDIIGIYGRKMKVFGNSRKRPMVGLRIGGKQTYFTVARLIAITFCPIPEHLKNYDINELEVHHINRNWYDNRKENLMWVSKEEHRKIHSEDEGYGQKSVAQIDGDMIVGLFPSISEAERQTGIDLRFISRVAKGERASTGGFKWAYELNGKYCLNLQQNGQV